MGQNVILKQEKKNHIFVKHNQNKNKIGTEIQYYGVISGMWLERKRSGAG